MARPVGIPMTEEQKELRRKPNPAHSKLMKERWAEGLTEGSRKTLLVKGQEAWNKGIPVSMEKKIKISSTLRGITPEEWTAFSKPENFRIRNSEQGRKWRKDVFERDDYTCQDCLQRGGKLVADHIKPFALYPELRLELDNGQTLCEDCHIMTDTYGHKTTKLMLDKKGVM